MSFRKIQHPLSIPPLWVKHSVIIQIVIFKGGLYTDKGMYERGSSNFLIVLNPAYIVAKFELAKYVEVKLARISDRAIRQIVNFGGYPRGSAKGSKIFLIDLNPAHVVPNLNWRSTMLCEKLALVKDYVICKCFFFWGGGLHTDRRRYGKI